MRNSLTDLAEGRVPTPPPPNADEVNEAELPNGIGTPLADAAARADHLLGEIIEPYERIGDYPFQWYAAKTTTEAVLRNSYTHPRNHLWEYWKENGDQERANRLFEAAAEDMRTASAPPLVMGQAVYNLACARSYQGRVDDAIAALEEAFRLRAEMKASAGNDEDLAPLRDDPRFQELIKT